MGVYDSEVATALELIAEAGAAVTWRSFDRSPADPAKPWDGGANTMTEHAAVVVFFPYDQMARAAFRQLAGTDTVIGSDYGLMPRVGFVPTVNDEVLNPLDGRVRTVLAIDPLAPNGEIIMYTLHFGAVE